MTSEYIGLASLIAANAAINIGIYKYFNSRMDRVYSRLDEVKKNVEDKFVTKSMCDVMHQSTASNLQGLEVRMCQRFDKVEQRMEVILNKILDSIK